MYSSVEKISAAAKQGNRIMTDNSCFLKAASSTFPVSLVCIVLVLMSSSHCLPDSSTLSVFLSHLFCCLRTSNRGSRVNVFSIPTLFIVLSFQDSPCFSSLHHFVAVGPFPLYMLLVWILLIWFPQICSRPLHFLWFILQER